ncbi:MAG: glycosyltransferase family 1 protein [Bacteriovorax sp.]|jgi:glycosyltransferase involved in cell wall biosynthesis
MHTNPRILIDFEKIKDPYSGLGQFCAHLKVYFDQSALNLAYWIPNKFEKFAKKIPFILPRCDVFHAVHQDSPFMPWSKNTKYILTIHDLNALYETENTIIKEKFKHDLQKKINRADIVTFISNFTRSEVESNFNLENKKIAIIYNGISLTNKANRPLVAPNTNFLFSIGTVLPKKNFHVLIDFLKLLPADYKIIIAGTTFHSYAEEMKKRILAENLSERFYLVGTIDEKEKRWYYEHACAFIFPSLLEGFGLPVAEAMSFGLPLFLSDKTSLPEIGGIDAFYFKSFEPASMKDIFLSGMKEFTPERKMRLIERSKIFDWKKAAEDYLNIYKSL